VSNGPRYPHVLTRHRSRVRRLPMLASSMHSRQLPRWAVLVVLALFASLGLAASPGVATRTPPGNHSKSKPTIGEVQTQLDALNRQAEIASESLNGARVQTAEARKRLATLEADVRRQRSSVAAIRSQVVSATLADYQGSGGLSTATSFLVADDPKTFLANLADDAVAEHQQADMLTSLMDQQRVLAARDAQAKTELAAVQADRAKIAERKTALAAKIAKAQHLLGSLQAKQRAHLLALQQAQDQSAAPDQPSRDVNRPAPDVPTSARAEIAVQTALAQIGDPYVYGAAGPDAFDCSGLTMYAWAAAGVSIPHASWMQPHSGTPVSISALRPGDLVFYYSPISHVGMYIGHGEIVHAPHPGSSVQIVPLTSMPIAMAVRIG
jgi:cell wall-associated NlpC family hydrolase